MKRKQLLAMSAAFVVLSVCVLMLIADQATLARQADVWGLLPQPERYSELYYGNYRQLATARLGRPCAISFTIVNSEHRRTDYYYQLLAQTASGNATVTLASGAISIPANGQQTVTNTVTVPKLGDRVRATTVVTYVSKRPGTHTLRNQSQTIGYWITASKTAHKGGNA